MDGLGFLWQTALGVHVMVILHLLTHHLPGAEPFFGVLFINQYFYKPDLDISIQIHKSSQLT